MTRAWRARCDRGFTLVELMVAMAVGVILLAAVYQFFIAQRRTYTAQDEINRMQQDARVASTLLTKAVQQTGAFSPSPGSTVSLRGQVILAASDHYLVLQADDPYRTGDNGIITADEVVAFVVSTAGGTATERVGDDPAVTNKMTRTVRVFYDQDSPPNGVDADEDVDLEIPMALAGPPYTLYRVTPDPAGGATPVFEEIASNVDNFVLRYYDQNGDPVLPVDPGTGATLPAFWPLGADERALVRSVEMELTLRTRNPDPEYAATFAVEDNTVATYDGSGTPQTGVSFVNDGFRRRTFTARVSPRNLSANSCGRITIVANPGNVPCTTTASSTVTAALIDQFGDPVANQPAVFQLDPSSGASFAPLPTMTTTTTATTNVNGEASVPVYYQGLAQALSVSATAEVDCRPTGPQRFTLQNAVSVGFGPGYADRVEITALPSAPVDTFQSSGSGCTPNEWTFQAAGFDLCGNPAAEDPANPFQFEAVNGTIASPTLDAPTKTFTVTLAGTAGVTTSELWLSSGAGLGTPSEIDVDGTVVTAPYSAPLHTVNLHPWPPVDIVPDPATWLDGFDPVPPATVHKDCADTTVLTSNPFDLEDCADNPVTEVIAGGGFGYDLVPTLTGPGTLTVVDNGAANRVLEYTIDGCGTPPGSSFTSQAGVDLNSGGGSTLDSAGPKAIVVEGCATCSVRVVKNPTPCDLSGTVEISGCDMVGKTVEVVLSTTTGGARASFSPPMTAAVSSVQHTFASNSPLLLDVYVTRANPGDQIAVTAYYPDATANFWSCAGTLTVDTHCDALQLFADSLFSDRIETGGTITCLEQVRELHARVQDCQATGVNPSDEVTVFLYADGALYDVESIDMAPDPGDPDYLISDTTSPLTVALNDGYVYFGDGRLEYPAGKSVRLVARYYDPADGEYCYETVDGLVSPASVCFFNALASGDNADLPPSLDVHWGDVVVEGTADLRGAAPTVSKRSAATLTSSSSDRFLDVYLGRDAGGAGGYYLTSSGDTSGAGFRPFLLSDDLGNYFQDVSNIGIQTLAPDLEYDALRSFARSQAGQKAYWYALSGSSSCADGPELSNLSGTATACLSDVLTTVTAPLLFIDTFGTAGTPPAVTGAAIDAAPLSGTGALPAWTLGDLFTGNIPHRVIYIAGSVRFTTTSGGQTLTVTSPPQYDAHYYDNPLPGTGVPAWAPSEASLPIEFDSTATTQAITLTGVNVRAGLYLDGAVTFDGSPVIFGSLVAERGVRYASGNPEIWYDYDLRGASVSTCSQCGTRPRTGCAMTVSPGAMNFSNPFEWQNASVSGTLGLLTGTVADPAIATLYMPSGWVESNNVGSTSITFSDSLQPACAVQVPVTVGCNPGLSASTTSLTYGPSNNYASLVGSGSLWWSVASGSAVTLSGSNPSSSIGVNAAQVGSAQVSGAFLGTSCADSVTFSVGCGITAWVASGSPPGNVLFPGGAGITLQAAYASGGVDRWEQASPASPALTVAGSGNTASVTLAGNPTTTAPVTVNVVDADGCQDGVQLVACPLDIDVGTGSVYEGDTLSISVTGDSGSGAVWSCTPAGGDATWSTGGSPAASTTLTGVSAGNVVCRAEDAAYPACYTEETVTVVGCPTGLTVNSSSIRAGDPAAQMLTATGFPGTVSWSQSGSGSVTIDTRSSQTSPAIAGVTDGAVTITASDSTLPASCDQSATITVTPACVDLTIPAPTPGSSYGTATANGASMVWEGIPDDLDGGNRLDDIDKLYFSAIDAGGTVTYSHSEGVSGYCGFGGNTCSASPGDVSGWADGTYTLEVRAETKGSHPCGVTSITRSVQITIDNTP